MSTCQCGHAAETHTDNWGRCQHRRDEYSRCWCPRFEEDWEA